MNEISELLKELRNMKSDSNTIQNTKNTWESIGNKDFSSAGFSSEQEMLEWLEKNSYSNLC